jgi:hypothetical protein
MHRRKTVRKNEEVKWRKGGERREKIPSPIFLFNIFVK